MNKFLVTSNIVLIIAVIFLFYLHFSNGKSSVAKLLPNNNAHSEDATNGAFKIGYFELDSLDNNYKYLQDVKAQLIAKDKEVQSKITNLQNQFNAKYQEYAQKGATVSQSEQMKISQIIGELKKQTGEKINRLDQSFSMERVMKLQEIKSRIQAYLKSFAKAKGYNFIIGTNEADYFYYKDSSQDITKQLVESLNKNYEDSLKTNKTH